MKLSPEERQHRRQVFRQMNGRQKLEHLWAYYKVPFFAVLLCLALLVSTVQHLASQKEPVLYLGELNVAAGEDLNRKLTDSYLTYSGANPAKQQVLLYKGLYITEDASTENHQYAYASSMKLMASVAAKELDLVLMNREAYDLCSRNGYLAELSQSLPGALTPLLTENQVVLDTSENPASEAAKLETNAVRVTSLPIFAGAGFSEELYLGIIANTPRMSACTDYLRYLCAAE